MQPKLPEKIQQDKLRFESWRAQRKGKKAIPEELWEMVAAHIAELGLNRVSREFGLNYTQLKQKALTLGIVLPERSSSKQSSAAPFIPIPLPEGWNPGVSAGYGPRLILERPDGRQLRIEGGWPEPQYLDILIQGFYRG
jgi:hypothetical protein